jgi:hypothetical protein
VLTMHGFTGFTGEHEGQQGAAASEA